MSISLAALAAIFAVAAAIFAFLAFLEGRRATHAGPQFKEISDLTRSEGDRLRQFVEEQSRGLRLELGGRVDGGVQSIGDRTGAIGTKLDQEIAHMGEEANRNREVLRQTIEGKLDTAADRQALTAKSFREETTQSFDTLSGRVVDALTQAGNFQKGASRVPVTTALGALTDKQEKSLICFDRSG